MFATLGDMGRIPLVRARIVRSSPVQSAVLHRVGYLTPYLVQTIADDVRRGGRVEVEVAAEADETALAWARDCCAALRAARIQVVCRRSRRPAA
jgi:hypothetical protein